MRDFPRRVQAHRLGIGTERDVVLSLEFAQTREERWEFCAKTRWR